MRNLAAKIQKKSHIYKYMQDFYVFNANEPAF